LTDKDIEDNDESIITLNYLVREAFAVGYIINWVGDRKKWRGTIQPSLCPGAD